jgi:hypothetical protein
MHLSPRSTPPLCAELSTCRATTSVGRANSSRAACQCRHQIHQRDLCPFVRESNPPRPVAIKTELPTRGSCERMCSDTAREARSSVRSDRRTCRRYRPLDVDALSVRSIPGCRSEPRLSPPHCRGNSGQIRSSSNVSASVFTRVRGYRRAKNELSTLIRSMLPSASEVAICQTPGAAVPGRQSPVLSLLSPRSHKLRPDYRRRDTTAVAAAAAELTRTLWHTRSPGRSVHVRFYASGLSGTPVRLLRRRHLAPQHFTIHVPCGFSSARRALQVCE